MKARIGLVLVGMILGGCVSGGTSKTCVTEITMPDGSVQSAVIESEDAGAAQSLCEGDTASLATVTTAMIGGKPQKSVPNQSTPVQKPAQVAAPVFVPRTAPVTAQPLRKGAQPGCGLRMVGGTGYVCALQ